MLCSFNRHAWHDNLQLSKVYLFFLFPVAASCRGEKLRIKMLSPNDTCICPWSLCILITKHILYIMLLNTYMNIWWQCLQIGPIPAESLYEPTLLPLYASIMSLRHGATLLVVKQDMLGVLFDDVRQPRFVWDVPTKPKFLFIMLSMLLWSQ